MPVILLGFDGFFLRFHEVFFSGDTWRFSDTDTLLRIYPETFWQDTAKLAAAIVVAQAVVVGLAAGWWVRRIRPVSARAGGRIVIDLHGPPGGVLRIGHRGAATLAPENTLRSFRAAVEVGVDLIEFDVLDLQRGPLVLAHSDHLEEVSHGAARGRVRSLTLEQLREVAPELPTLDEALAFFVDEAPGRRTSRRPQAAACASTSSPRRSCATGSRLARSSAACTSPTCSPSGGRRRRCGSGSRIRRTSSRSPASRICGRSCRSG